MGQMDAMPHLLKWASTVSCEPCENEGYLLNKVLFSKLFQRIQPHFDSPSEEDETEYILGCLADILMVNRSELESLEEALVTGESHDEFQVSMQMMLRLLLAQAVQGDEKELHVSTIMGLPAETQHALMLEIEKGIAELGRLRESSSPPPVHEVILEENESQLNRDINEDYAEATIQLKRIGRENVALKDENKDLLEENNSLRLQVDKLETEVHDLKQVCSESAIKTELESQKQAMKREIELTRSNELLSKQLEELQEELKEGTKARAELSMLRDEVEVLQAEATKVKKLQQSIDRLKSKLEDSTGIRNQLDEALKKNQELINRSLDYDENMRTIQTLHRDLDSLRRSQTDAEVSLSEAKALCREKDIEIKELIERCTMLEHNEQVVARENASLQEDLQEAGVQDLPSVTGLGMGLTELNPEISEEMARLRRENERLKGEFSEEAKEAFQELTRNCDKFERLRDHFEAEYHQSKKQCEQLKTELDDCLKRNSNLNNKLASIEVQLNIAQTELKEKHHDLMESKDLAANQNTMIAKLDYDNLELMQSIFDLEEEYFALGFLADESNEEHKAELETVCRQHEELVSKIEDESNSKLDAMIQEHQSAIERIQGENEENLKALHVEHTEVLRELNVVHDQNMEAFQLKHSVSNDEHENALGSLSMELHSLQETSAAKISQLQQALNDTQAELVSERDTANLDREKLQSELTLANKQFKSLKKTLAECQSALSERNTKLQEYEKAFQLGKQQLEVASRDARDQEQRIRELNDHVDQYKSQLMLSDRKLQQSKKQCQALQMQQSEAARALEDGSGVSRSQVREMREEIERLVSEKQRLAQQYEELCAENLNSASHEGSSDGRGVGEMIRNYEKKIIDLEKEKNAISLGRTNEMSLRFDAEKKLGKAMEELEATKASLVQLQLRAERSRYQEKVYSPSRQAANKENNPSVSSPSTDSSLRTRRPVPSNVLSPARSALDSNIAALKSQQTSSQNKEECKQQ